MLVAPCHPQEARRVRALRASALLDTPPDLDLDALTKLASVICETPIALISLVDENRQWFMSRVGLDAAETPRDVSFCGHAILGKDAFIVEDAHLDVRFADNPLVQGAPHIRFYAGAPLAGPGGEMLGTLCVIDQVPRRLTPAQLEALNALARLAAGHIRLLARTKDLVLRATEAELLHELSELLHSCRSVAETHQVVSLLAPRMFPGGRGFVAATRDSRHLVEQCAAWGAPKEGDALFEPEDCWALRRGRAHRVAGAGAGLWCRHVAAGAKGYACIPMMAHGETLGIVHVEEDHEDDEADARFNLVVSLTERVALAMANLRMRETLRTQSMRDALTGLYNRRCFDEVLEREVRRCKRHGRPLVLLMIDVDHFKQYNDVYGHEAGDAVLAALGSHLPRAVRAEDIVCRYGGEELAIIMPDADPEATIARARALCALVKTIAVFSRSTVLHPVTISVGMAALEIDAAEAEDLTRAADRALYRAKAEGRDRVVAAWHRGAKESETLPAAAE